MRRGVLISVLGIGCLFGASLWLLTWLDAAEPAAVASVAPPDRPPDPILEPTSPPSPAPALQPKAIEPPPPTTPLPTAAIDDALPPAPTSPTYDISDTIAPLKAAVVAQCGSLEVRYASELRRDRERLTGQAVLLLEVEPRTDELHVWNATTQAPGFTRPALVACAQWAVKSKTLPARGVRPGPRFQVQLVVSVKGPAPGR